MKNTEYIEISQGKILTIILLILFFQQCVYNNYLICIHRLMLHELQFTAKLCSVLNIANVYFVINQIIT